MATNRNNQPTFRVRADAFTDDIPADGPFVRGTGTVRVVTFGARVGAIIAALPAADRPGAIVAAVGAARAMSAAGHRSNAGTGRVDIHAYHASIGADMDAANAARRRLARTRTRRARAAAIVAANADA